MIFSVADHIQQILKGTKTQTRRPCDHNHPARHKIGKTYAIQPSRTSPAIAEGRILITDANYEWKYVFNAKQPGFPRRRFRISRKDAKAEGGYTPEEFEQLYDELHPNWVLRVAYKFKFVRTEETKRHETIHFDGENP